MAYCSPLLSFSFRNRRCDHRKRLRQFLWQFKSRESITAKRMQDHVCTGRRKSKIIIWMIWIVTKHYLKTKSAPQPLRSPNCIASQQGPKIIGDYFMWHHPGGVGGRLWPPHDEQASARGCGGPALAPHY